MEIIQGQQIRRTMMTDNEKLFRQKVEKLAEVYVAKNKDYGDSFSLSLDKYGILASLIRMGDKMNRIDSLYDKPTSEVDESLVDSLEDLANYAIMTAIWLEKQVEDMGNHVTYFDDDDFDDDFDDHEFDDLFDDDEDDEYDDDIDALLYMLSDIGSEDDESDGDGEIEEGTVFISGNPTHTFRKYPDGRTETIVNNIDDWEYIGEDKDNLENEDDTDDFSMDGKPKFRIKRRPKDELSNKGYWDMIRDLYRGEWD